MRAQLPRRLWLDAASYCLQNPSGSTSKLQYQAMATEVPVVWTARILLVPYRPSKTLAATGKTVRLLIIGNDGFTSNVESIRGLKADHPDLDLNLTTMIGPRWVDSVDLDIIEIFESSKTSLFLYHTCSLDDIATERGSAAVLCQHWKQVHHAKLGYGPERNKPAYRNIQAFYTLQYLTKVHACALCLRRFSNETCLRNFTPSPLNAGSVLEV